MKKTYSRFAVTLTLIASITACSTHSGNIKATDPAVIDKIKIGKTTKSETRSLLGDTQNIMREGSGKDTWIYDYSKTNMGPKAFIPFVNMTGESAVDMKMSTLTIVFDKEGIVENVISRINDDAKPSALLR
jgi:outer membrane protein assembly factor BamE (lipoprotein component of BamABCDE complex)